MLSSLSVAHNLGRLCCKPTLIQSMRCMQMPSCDYKGVSLRYGKWRARVSHKGRVHYAGSEHETPKEAAKALDQ